MAIRPERLRVAAPAKINLFLHVMRKRADGYHDLQSLVAFADIGDELALARDTDFSLAVEGAFAKVLEGEGDNLVLRAARALAARLPNIAGARITLTKNLPVASGVGGGSADAAAALRGLVALYGEALDANALIALAASLGSDISVCVASEPAWMEGRGEILTPLAPLPPAHIVLVNPGVAVATAQVFRSLVIRSEELPLAPPPAFASLSALTRYLARTRNDLEAPALAIAPTIQAALDALSRNGAAFARMSGSGATCFGLFETAAKAQAAARAIAKTEPDWWARAGALADPSAAKPREF
ncbi:MAG TPA: 4-(cytidine 5'-diphospho)-2-C-methyl-D-erythritol kinase [Rhizomicrobium sp.]|nr:4-(cytidine 5'-diphospho)-2-C-methyl-D-erythritol kinase [Rhizomicrobium sp.]